MLGEFGLTWPWESLHVEALAWFDHWLKGRDTGILDGPADPLPACPAPTDGARAESWPPAGELHRELALRADGDARRRRRRAGSARLHGARRGPEPSQAQRDRSAVDA